MSLNTSHHLGKTSGPFHFISGSPQDCALKALKAWSLLWNITCSQGRSWKSWELWQNVTLVLAGTFWQTGVPSRFYYPSDILSRAPEFLAIKCWVSWLSASPQRCLWSLQGHTPKSQCRPSMCSWIQHKPAALRWIWMHGCHWGRSSVIDPQRWVETHQPTKVPSNAPVRNICNYLYYSGNVYIMIADALERNIPWCSFSDGVAVLQWSFLAALVFSVAAHIHRILFPVLLVTWPPHIHLSLRVLLLLVHAESPLPLHGF